MEIIATMNRRTNKAGENSISKIVNSNIVTEFHNPTDLGEVSRTATWGEPMLSQNIKHSNYSPPQGHAGDMNSCRQTSPVPTGLFSLNPVVVRFARNKVVEVSELRTGEDIPVLT